MWFHIGWLICFALCAPAWAGPLSDPDWSSPTPYGLLGIDPNDPDLNDPVLAPALVRKAYRRAVQLCHPDKYPEPTSEGRFKRVHQAYETLSKAPTGGQRRDAPPPPPDAARRPEPQPP